MTKFYAVKCGRRPGIYRSWDDCKKQIAGFSGAEFKSFPTMEEAKAFAAADEPVRDEPDGREAYAFVDGSFNIATGVYGYGGFLVFEGQRYPLSGSGRDPEMAAMRNVAGEILGSQAAMEKALSLGLKSLTIYYDYMGIECWARGTWKRNKAGTIAYYEYVQSIKDRLSLTFCKVKGHSGVEGNEEADRLAKEAVGIL